VVVPQGKPAWGIDLSILVLSCDRHKDLWPVFNYYFEAYWGDCPVPVYILANEETFQSRRITSLYTGPDVSWSASLISALNQINTKFVSFVHEDTLPHSPFRQDIIISTMSFLEKVGGTCVKLRRFPFPLSPVANEPAMGRLSTRLPYRNYLFISIWDRLKLLKHLKPDESSFDWETKANSRTECDEEFYSVREDHFRFLHALVKGRWIRSAYRQVLTDIPGYTASRPIMSAREESVFNAYVAAHGLFIKTFGVRIFKAIHKVRWSSRLSHISIG
jgi:hypothetical protein